MILSDEEAACVELLATLFELDSQKAWEAADVTGPLSLGKGEYERMMLVLKNVGAFEEAINVGGEIRPSSFRLSPVVLGLAREIAEQRREKKEALPPDLIERLNRRLRGNPWTAYPLALVILGLALVGAVTLVVEALQAFGIMEK